MKTSLTEVVPFLENLEEKDTKKKRRILEAENATIHPKSLASLEVIATVYEND